MFVRCGADGQPDREIRANVRAVTATEFATVLGDAAGPLCSTAEHVLAALSGLGVDNAIIEIDGPEVPIMDGSAAPFVAAIDRAGVISLSEPRQYMRILKPVRVVQDDAYGELRPYSQGFRIEFEIQFDHTLIGRQELALDIEPETFRRELARARTFGFMRDVAKLWNAGFALGASFENTLVVNENRLLNPEGLRFADEFVRHKALDAIGDLASRVRRCLAHLGRYAAARSIMRCVGAYCRSIGLDAGRRPGDSPTSPTRGAPPRYPRSCRIGHWSGGAGLRSGRILTPVCRLIPGRMSA
jgi:UDP-3-O-[3-hydroxymyristoyl] N-acetylglucosamine deacetylase